MDYYATMLLILIALALVMLFLLLHLKLYRTAFAFGLAVLVSLFFFMQKHPRKVIAIEDVPNKQGVRKNAVQGDSDSGKGPGRPGWIDGSQWM